MAFSTGIMLKMLIHYRLGFIVLILGARVDISKSVVKLCESKALLQQSQWE